MHETPHYLPNEIYTKFELTRSETAFLQLLPNPTRPQVDAFISGVCQKAVLPEVRNIVLGLGNVATLPMRAYQDLDEVQKHLKNKNGSLYFLDPSDTVRFEAKLYRWLEKARFETTS